MPDRRFERTLFEIGWIRRVIIAPLSMVLVSSCHRAEPAMGVTVRSASPGVSAFFNTNFPGVPSVADIAGYNDEQRLPGNGSTDYGDVVRLYVAPRPPTQQEINAGALVALIEVQGDANGGSPFAAYNMLKIDNIAGTAAKLYCVFIRPGQPTGSFDGYVTPVQSDGTTCTPIGSSNQYKLSVEPDPSEPVTPYVARFVEDANGNPAIGVGCGTPPNFVFCHLGRGVGMGKKALDDEQDLALPAGTTVSRSAIRGRVTAAPAPGTFGATPLRVATISLSAAPPNPSRYYEWGIGAGDSGVWLSIDAQGAWWAQFVPGTAAPTGQTKFPVDRQTHPSVPLSARWLWSDTDEDVWVPCDQGCCTITGLGGKGGRGPH